MKSKLQRCRRPQMNLHRTARVLALILCTFPLAVNSQRSSSPSNLSCWQGKSFRTRTAKTQTVQSNGSFVYGLVTALAKSESDGAQICSNRVQLFLSHDGRTYKKVFEDFKEFQGLGIEIVGWSPDQKRVLFQTRHWPYDSDFFDEFTAFVLDSHEGRPKNLNLNEAFTKHFGDKCEFEARVQAWQDDQTLRVLVSRTPETESYEQVFCVKRPTTYVLNLQSRQVSEYAH